MSSVYFLIGKTLGKYKILEHIGHGGMSEVYKGQQTHLERPVAVKVLHPFLADERGFVTRFQREARIVATLRHPNIVQVFDFDFNEELGIYYMVMEYIGGSTLKSLMEDGALPTEKAMRVGIAIANALDYAHRRDMVHRDVKPANIMFLDDTQPVLTDFGIAKMLTLSGLTASGAMVGTPAYIAPEVGIGKAGTASSDIYSLGVVLYQAVTGKLPFTSESPMGMVMQHINDAPPRPSKYLPDIPPALEAVIIRALEKQPENRYPNARAMALDISGILSPTASQIQNAPFSTDDVSDDDMWQILNELEGSSLVADDDRLMFVEDETESVEEPEPLQEDSFEPVLIVQDPAEISTPPFDALEEAGKSITTRNLGGNNNKRKRRGRPVLAFLTLIIALAAVAWSNFIGLIHLPVDWLPVMPTGVIMTPIPGELSTVTPTATQATSETTATPDDATAIIETTATPEPVATATPTATTVCKPRLRVDDIRIEPDDSVWAGANMVARVNLSNPGKCAWPVASAFEYADGQQLGMIENFALDALSPGETLHLVIPFTAPEEIGTYASTWLVHAAGDSDFGQEVEINFDVQDIEAPDPTPMPELSAAVSVSEPITVTTPVITELVFSEDYRQWQGTYTVDAIGGSGTYQFYQNTISAETELIDNLFAVSGKRCEAAPVTLWVLSGAEILKWESEVPFPDPTLCN